MALLYVPDDVGRRELERLRDKLKAQRIARGWSYERAGQEINRSLNFLYEMENLKSALKMDSLQLWASIYDMRVEVQLANFWNFAWPDDELALLYRMSRPFDAAYLQRLWLVSAVRAWRERRGIKSVDIGKAMGFNPRAVSQWECNTTNPFVARVMTMASIMGTSVQMELFTREEWIYG